MESTQAYHCPRWQELPDIPLYLDQLVMVIQAAVGPLAGEDEPAVTKTMINNYVKQKLVNPPEGKKYTRHHMARLVVISLLKRVYSMQEIHALVEAMVEVHGTEVAYDMFCEKLEDMANGSLQAEAGAIVKKGRLQTEPLLETALTALGGKLVVQRYLAQAEKNQ